MLEHEFSRAGETTRTFPILDGDGYPVSLVSEFVPNCDIAGGYISATCVIDEDEYNAHTGLYQMGTRWRVRDPDNGQFPFMGYIWDPAVSGGRVVITAEGDGKRADKDISRYLLQTQSMDVWYPGDQEPFDTGRQDERFHLEVLDRAVRWLVLPNTSFRRTQAGLPAQWQSTVVAWFPSIDVRFLGFTLDKSRDNSNYDLQVFRANGPQGALTHVQTWDLGAGTPDGDYTVSIPAGSDMVLIRIRRTTTRKRSRRFRLVLKNLRVGSVATSDTFQLDDFYADFFTRMGAASTSIAASSQSVLPFDAQNATLGQIADELSLLESWYWRMWGTPGSFGAAGAMLGEAGPRDAAPLYRISESHQAIQLVPQERWNKVYGPYDAGHEVIAYKTVTANPNPFPSGFNRTFKLDWDEPPPEALATVFFQHVADYLAKRDVTGRATVSQVELDSAPGVALLPTVLRPGDRLKLMNNGAVIVTLANIRVSASGRIAELEFTSGDPVLDRWLSERQRLLNRGRGTISATLGALDPDQPKVPTNFTVEYERIGRKSKRKYNAILRWNEVTEDVENEGTFVTAYEVRGRATDQAGNPIQLEGGGGLRPHLRRKITLSTDEDAQDAFDLPTRMVFRDLDRPRVWYWQFQGRAIDGLGQESNWTAWTTPALPAQEAVLEPTNVTIHTDFIDDITITWDQPLDPDDDSIEHDDIVGYQIQLATSSGFGGASIYRFDRSQQGEQKNFRIKQADRGNTFYGRVRAYDIDGDFSEWIPARLAGNSSAAASPDGVNLRRDRVIARWDHNKPTVKHYRKEWTSDRRYRFKKARITAGSHEAADHPANDGTPGGQALKANVWWHSADGSTQQALFDTDDRLTVPANGHKDVNFAALFNRKYINEDESLTVKIAQQGSTRQATDVVIQVYMEPVTDAVPDEP